MTHSRPVHSHTILSLERLGTDMCRLRLDYDRTLHGVFQPGQYMFLSTSADDARAFSIASMPDDPYLEFHIRNSGHGISRYIFDAAKTGDVLMASPPEGSTVFRAQTTRPLLVLAGGLGIAPMKSIIRAALADRHPETISLYWGVRDETHLYLDGFFQALSREHASFRYTAVLQESHDAQRPTGFLPDILAREKPPIAGADIYMAGPPPMTAALHAFLLNNGADDAHIFCDAFA